MYQLVVMVLSENMEVKYTYICLFTSVFLLMAYIYLFHNVFSFFSSFLPPQLLDSKITYIKSISLSS